MKFQYSLIIFKLYFIFSQEFNNEENFSDPTVIKGWFKFFAYEDTSFLQSFPTKFEHNPAFSFSNKKTKGSDEWGSYDIPSEDSFFFILTKTTLFATNSRRVIFLFLMIS